MAAWVKGPACLVLALVVGCSSLTSYEPETYVVRAGDTLYSIAFRHGIDYRELARWNNLANPDRLAVGQRLLLTPQARASTVVARPAAPAPARPPPRSAPMFSWPSSGTVVARFGDRGVLTTGIAISGQRGQAIRAAAAGRVVYAGSGLPDYGQLVIIQHDESWLTAYGHNQSVLVAQGQSVGRGEQIGTMGLGPGLEPRLYFEVRRNGDPLDPLGFLPSN